MTGTTPPKVTSRTPRPRRPEVRTRILDAAATVVAERGLAAATLDQVAAAAGFTKGAVYSNFASKDELFLALLEAQVAARVADVEQTLAAARTVPEALAAVSADLARPDPRTQLLAVEFWQRAVRDPSVAAAFAESRRRLRAQVVAAAAAFLAGLPEDPGWTAEALALVVIALAHGLAFEELADPGSVPPGLAARVLGALVGSATDPAETDS
ncbi:TetR/AcrR family transcriptional regulator [Petropleomorpha daqingensis]|uniref:AcrR family transcriptional regulator n=1 Tax=Petropleomorpha daqingensis TaxID=2026353 RepID=A0A853CDA0_9ACTN|nr:AcrR family transcriptional regulator [Petropleomorpha daqingensis]